MVSRFKLKQISIRYGRMEELSPDVIKMFEEKSAKKKETGKSYGEAAPVRSKIFLHNHGNRYLGSIQPRGQVPWFNEP